MADVLLIIALRQFWFRRLFFGKLYQKKGGHMVMTKIGTTWETGQTSSLNWSDRSGQFVQNAK